MFFTRLTSAIVFNGSFTSEDHEDFEKGIFYYRCRVSYNALDVSRTQDFTFLTGITTFYEILDKYIVDTNAH